MKEFDEMTEKLKKILLHAIDKRKIYFNITNNYRSLTYVIRFWHTFDIKSLWYIADFLHNANYYVEIKISYFEIKDKDSEEIKDFIIEKLEEKRG